jgi:hypothetical protein
MSLKKISALVFSLMAVVGCSLNRPNEPRPSSVIDRVGGGGQIIEPKRCLLTVAILSRPLHDEAINSALWGVADEQGVAPAARRALQDNGLRLGLITGDLPVAVDAVFKAPPPHKVNPAKYLIADGQNTLIAVGMATPQVSLLLNDMDRTHGKDYTDASGYLRMTARFEGPTAVALRFVPEIHHGPIRNTFGAAPDAGVTSPHQFTMKNGQEEDTLRELAAGLTLQPDQIAVIGCLPDRPRSLGAFLFTQPEANSDRLLQKVVLVWAARNQTGTPDGADASPQLTPVEPPKQ